MKIVHHIFLILTAFMPIVSSAGSLETLNIQSCHYICGVSEFMTIIPEDRIHNTVLITTAYTGRGVQNFIRTTLSAAYQALPILDASYYHTAHEFQEVFQSMLSEHIIYVVFDSAFFKENVSFPFPLPPIEAMHSLAILKQDGSVSIKNDDMVKPNTTHYSYFFSLCVWHRTITSSFLIQEKEKINKLIIKSLDKVLLLLTQQNSTYLQTEHDQNDVYDFANTTPTPYPCLVSPPAHLMLPPAYLMPPPPHLIPPPAHLMPPPRLLVPSFPHPSTSMPLFTASVPSYAIPPILPPPFLPSPSPQITANIVPYKNTMHTHLSTKNAPSNVTKEDHDKEKSSFQRQVYKIESFKIVICDPRQMWHTGAQRFGYITFDDTRYAPTFFLSNFFSYQTFFAADHQKTSWMTVSLWMTFKKLDYFHPLLPTTFKQELVSKMQNYNPITQSPLLDLLGELKNSPYQKSHHFCKEKWKKVSVIFKFQTLYHKFYNNLELKLKLLETGNKILIYQHKYTNPDNNPTKNDTKEDFWGGHAISGRGYNVLGNLLCLVREYLKNNQIPPSTIMRDI